MSTADALTTTYAEMDAARWAAFFGALRPELRQADTLEQAAQHTAQALWEAMRSSTALVRLYAVLPQQDLPRDVQAFANDLAATHRQALPLRGNTRVLALMGTYGTATAWRDRRSSARHKGIPLLSSAFVDDIPMLARLLRELGMDLSWLDEAPEIITRRLIGGFNGTFYVENAGSVRDQYGRLVIPAADFVEEQDIGTVFGMGGHYADGTLIVCIVFTREILTRAAAERLAPLISMFKGETCGAVLARRLFNS